METEAGSHVIIEAGIHGSTSPPIIRSLNTASDGIDGSFLVAVGGVAFSLFR